MNAVLSIKSTKSTINIKLVLLYFFNIIIVLLQIVLNLNIYFTNKLISYISE